MEITSVHNLTIVKRSREPRPNPAIGIPSLSYVEADSKAICLCGWSSDWCSAEQLAREEYGKHQFKAVRSIWLK